MVHFRDRRNKDQLPTRLSWRRSRLKIDAFPISATACCRGDPAVGEDLISTNAMAATPANASTDRRAVHRSQVELSGTEPAIAGGNAPYPGMTLTAEVKVGSRSVIAYFYHYARLQQRSK
jgi:HlyD family secretion protein